jgi:hypothetical protein
VSGWVLFTFDLLVTGLVCVIYVQTGRLIRWLFKRDASGGSGGGTPWRYSPFGPPGGPHPRASGRRSPQRSAGTARPVRRAVR